MAKRNIYRKWYNPDNFEREENYLLIKPDGLMLQISFMEDSHYGDKCTIYQTKPLNPLDVKTFIKHKEKCSKAEWLKAQKRAMKLIKN